MRDSFTILPTCYSISVQVFVLQCSCTEIEYNSISPLHNTTQYTVKWSLQIACKTVFVSVCAPHALGWRDSYTRTHRSVFAHVTGKRSKWEGESARIFVYIVHVALNSTMWRYGEHERKQNIDNSRATGYVAFFTVCSFVYVAVHTKISTNGSEQCVSLAHWSIQQMFMHWKIEVAHRLKCEIFWLKKLCTFPFCAYYVLISKHLTVCLPICQVNAFRYQYTELYQNMTNTFRIEVR